MARPPAEPTPQAETEEVRVTRWRFAPGAETGWHRHGFDYVIVPVTPCEMLLEEPGGGARTVRFEPGQSYARPAGVEHNVINAGDAEMVFVEVELLRRAG